MPYSKKLNLEFKKTESGVLFSDGIAYDFSEMKMIMKLSDKDLKSVHSVKKIFSGEVVK